MEYYEPGDDTFTLLDVLEDNLKNKEHLVILEIGTGSGIISRYIYQVLKCGFVLSTDVNQHALLHCLEKGSRFSNDLIKSSLLKNINQNMLDVIIFNPPYVPTPDDECFHNDIRASWAGGAKGRRIIDQFIKELNKFKGLMFLVVIEPNNPKEVIKLLETKGYKTNIANVRRILGEVLYVIKAEGSD
ncbi:Methyltransferase N6AMT1 [Astathelohania contejeani]|uniref:Methyltransferase N6AMT1 n=1 Tax=Astathelohania contejeani TaxID=164912 RepID=A0ABQ7I234_9MICR|nr:Methyltransferase N6AMT1 [Thelohania contejeani]